MTNRELAKLSGYDESSISRWKNSTRQKDIFRISWLTLGAELTKMNIESDEAMVLIKGAIKTKRFVADELEKIG